MKYMVYGRYADTKIRLQGEYDSLERAKILEAILENEEGMECEIKKGEG